MGKEKNESKEGWPSAGGTRIGRHGQQKLTATKNVTGTRGSDRMETRCLCFDALANYPALPVFLGKADKK